MKFLLFSEFGEIADLGMHLQDVEGHEVLFYVRDKDSRKIADGILTHIEDWYRYLGKGYVWVFDSCSIGDFQDWLREKGEFVFGGCAEGDKLENDRQAGQDWFSEAGFDQVESANFTDFEEARAFVEGSDCRWILKQNADAPKSLNHMGKFEDGSDMLYHLDELKKRWNEAQFGPIDFDLMEVVEGLEVAASAFFNGNDWMRDSAGKVTGYLNFEEKKEADGGTGETCGEMGTTFWGCTEDNELFREMICRPKIKERLRKIGFRGVFDINCIVTDEKKIVALEPTCRFGIPATSYEFCEGIESGAGKLIEDVAKGIRTPVALYQGWGIVMCVMAKPFPLEADVDDEATSIGERLWVLKDGKPVQELDADQRKHIHLYNFKQDEEGLKVATKNGYLLTVTALGTEIAAIREWLIGYIKDNFMISGAKWRSDIGMRVEEYEKEMEDVLQTEED
jgi:phosphoribosylamine-glycine ligase